MLLMCWPQPEPDPCQAAYDDCLQSSEDPTRCDAIWEMCYLPDPCQQQEYDACTAEFGPMAPECDDAWNWCWPGARA
ncbi:MAG: hypothetical protein U0168_21855 [Nannocystaceae bacterium]